MNESEILAAIRKALGREPDLVLWRLTQGGVVSRGDGPSYRAGLNVNGAADLVGILTVQRLRPPLWYPDGSVGVDVEYTAHGIFFALEVKSARGKQRPEQKLWGELVRARGGFYAVVRSVEEAKAALDRARRGEHA